MLLNSLCNALCGKILQAVSLSILVQDTKVTRLAFFFEQPFKKGFFT